MPRPDLTGALFVGAGPAGLAPLLWAARAGLLPDLARRGLMVVEADPAPGAGRIGHAIHSDTAAATFLECLTDGAAPRLAALRTHPSALRIAGYGHNAVPLADVAVFLHALGRAMVATLADYDVPVIAARAVASRRTPQGWETEVEGADGIRHIASKALVLATGAVQRDDCLDDVSIGTLRLDSLGKPVLLSGTVLGTEGLVRMRAHLSGRENPRVAIVGGSHSALAAAWRVLHELLDVPFGARSVSILHRRPLRPFYATPADARADGFYDFDADDVCPVSGRLFRLAGFRFRARELVRSALGIGNAPPEPRLELVQLTKDGVTEGEARLRDADLVIAALGYRPQALPLFDPAGARIALASDVDAPLVNDDCELQDAAGRTVPDVYAIGLAAGFRPSGPLGGEPSFSGQTNGLWLWQNGVGERIVSRLLT